MAKRIYYHGDEDEEPCNALALIPERTSDGRCEAPATYHIQDTATLDTWFACADHKELLKLRGIAS